MNFHGEINTTAGPIGGTNRRLPDIWKISQLGYAQKISLEKGIEICLKGDR